jgi:hypothetical protein
MVRKFSIILILSLPSCVNHNLFPDEPIEETCAPETSWQDEILPIMTASCATSGCHDGVSRGDWTNYNEVKDYAAAIKRRTVDKSMPFDGPLPQDQINKIACWVDNGALNN